MKLRRLPRKIESYVLAVAGALVLTSALCSLELNLFEANLYDIRTRLIPSSEASREIVLVTLDNQSARVMSETPPLPLDVHTRFIERLEELEPRAVGYLIDMTRVAELNTDLFSGDFGTRFVEAARRLENKGTPFILGTPFDIAGEVLPPYPLNRLNHALALIHKDGNVFAEDRVTRRALLSLYGEPSLHLSLASRLMPEIKRENVRGQFLVPEVDAYYFFFRYHGDPATRPYRRISYFDILNGTVPTDSLKGKILLVGTTIKEDASDYLFTPFSTTPFTTSRLEAHANILDSILKNDGMRRPAPWVNWLVTFTLILIVLWAVLATTPLIGVAASFIVSIVFCIACGAFFYGGVWVQASQPIVGVFLGYYLAVPFRLLREHKKRWDFQRKHRLMTQVEELKTNFLNLVTHDLKTPVARIQGLAEVLSRKAGDRLVDRDRETLASIVSSTDELNRFITTILELNRVESNRTHVKREARDINVLVEQSIESLKSQAKIKKIEIAQDLEPQFPIKIDPALISKVINNLIDNAIKYSPENSKVTVSTREEGDFVVVSVADQGIGMTMGEMESLFTKFYRVKNSATAAVGGTGLGLYLTKYFIEAHNGKVEVQSAPGTGTTFKIFLPVRELLTGDDTSSRGLRIQLTKLFKRKKENDHVQSTRSR